MDTVPIDQCCYCGHPLQDPVLLSCLHNCCYSCVLEVSEQDPKNITCPTCNFKTDVSSVHRNPFLTSKKPSLEEYCFSCSRKGYEDEPSDMYCKKCPKVFCRPCSRDHEIHNEGHVTALQSTQATDEGCTAIVEPCREHNKSFEYLCFECSRICCIECVKKHCMISKHSVTPLPDKSEDVDTMMRSKRDEITKYLSEIEAFSTSLNRDQWLKEVNDARNACNDALKRNKKEVLDRLYEALNKAEQEVDELSGRLSDNLASEVKEINQLKLEARAASEYGSLVLDSGNAFWFLDQGRLVGSCLQRHAQRFSELSAAQATKDRLVLQNEFIGVVSNLVLKGMIGWPTLQSPKAKQPSTDQQDDGATQLVLPQQLSSLWNLKDVIQREERKLHAEILRLDLPHGDERNNCRLCTSDLTEGIRRSELIHGLTPSEVRSIGNVLFSLGFLTVVERENIMVRGTEPAEMAGYLVDAVIKKGPKCIKQLLDILRRPEINRPELANLVDSNVH